MKNILWLVSWYPNKFDKSNGNFIRRHAQAASLYANIHVIYIHPVEEDMDVPVEEVANKEGNFSEQIIYYKSPVGFLSKVKSINTYYNLSKRYVRQYIKEKGVPGYVHVHVPVRAGTIALWMQKKFNTRYALSEHYGIYNDLLIDSFNKRSFFYRNAVKRIIDNAQPFICVSQQLGNNVTEVVGKRDFIVIPNVVNTANFKYGEKQEKNNPFRFLHVSNMVAVKNVEGIIEATKLLASKRTDFEFHIVGRCPDNIRSYAEQGGLLNKHIFLKGEVPYAQVATEMQNADTFVLFSHTESGSCVLQESLCCGLPVISTPVGVAPELVNEQNGLLVNTNDNHSLANAMNEMINSKGKYNRVQISSQAVQLFSYEVIGKQIVDCYSH